MNIKEVKLKKEMSKKEVNELIGQWIELKDDVYIGNAYPHNWECKCGNVIKGRMWSNVRKRESCVLCKKCKRNKVTENHRYLVSFIEGYEYIESYLAGEFTQEGRLVKGGKPYMRIRHKYCRNEYTVGVANFINDNQRCGKCCQIYENSFAHHIEVELGLKIEDVWDFEKNDIDPYHIRKYSHEKIFIKCKKDESHPSYDTYAYIFIKGHRCSLCNNSKGEARISDFLFKNNIRYEYEKSYEGLFGIGGNLLSYDFYLLDKNILIEYQGEFHDGSTSFQTKEGLRQQQEHDRRKKQYAKDNNIKLLEIWYYDFDNIENILNKELINKNKLI